MRIKQLFDELGSDFLSLVMQTFDQIDDLVFVMSFNGNDYEYIYANKAAKETVRLPDLTNHVTMRSMVSEHAYISLRKHYDQARLSMEKTRFKMPIEHKGQHYIGESLLTPIYMEKLDIHFIMAIVRDITEHEHALQHLKEAQRQIDEERLRLESLIELNNEAIFQVDIHGHIIKCNPEAKSFLKATAGELEGSNLSDWFQESFFKEWFTTEPKPKKTSRHELWVTRVHQEEAHYIKVKFIPIFIAEQQQGWYLLVRDATAETNLQDELQRMAFIDHLSGLPNRRAFDDKMDYLLQQTAGTGDLLAIFLIDGYRFKDINDTFGHDAGDAVIQETAKRIQRVLRDHDIVARFGGDEFAVIIPQIKDIETIGEVARRILIQFDEPFSYHDYSIPIRIGMGGAYFPGTAKNKNQLLKEADHALYEIKEASGVGFQLYKKMPIDQ